MRIGLISDTHNLLRESAREFLRGSDLIVHAGDICGPEVLTELAKIAPLLAVRGNNDKGAWAAALPESLTHQVGGAGIHVIHDLAQLDLDLRGEHPAVQVIVSGHSHRPLARRQGGLLYVNPGSAGPRRFKLPISVGELVIEGGNVSARLIELPDTRRA